MRNGASDALFRGRGLSAERICALVEQMVAEEIDPLLDDPEIGKALARDKQQILAAVSACRALWQQRTHTQARALTLMRQEGQTSGNRWFALLAEAIASGDTQPLAL